MTLLPAMMQPPMLSTDLKALQFLPTRLTPSVGASAVDDVLCVAINRRSKDVDSKPVASRLFQPPWLQYSSAASMGWKGGRVV